MSDPRAEIGRLWFQVNREMHNRFHPAFRDQELPPMALILLRQIHEEPGVTISELARRSRTVKSHVSKLIDQLLQQGFLEKRSDPADQRIFRIYITQAAIDHKKAMEARIQVHWSQVLSDLPEAELEQVTQGLRILLDALGRSRGSTNTD